MANESGDLSESQTRDVAHFQEMMHCETDVAVDHLTRANWNLEAAVHNFLNPNAVPTAPSPPPLADATAESTDGQFPRLRPSRRPGDFDESSQNRPVAGPHLPAPVVTRNNASGVWSLLQPITELVLLPFRYAFSLLGTILRILTSFWVRPGIASPPTRVVDAAGDVQAFIRDIQQRYSTGDAELPRFFQGAYSAVLREAQRELVFLLVYIHADDNPEADAFCRNVLTAQQLREFITSNRVILWGCNVGRAEGQRVAHAIRATQFPVLALISFKNGSMTIVLRISGGRMADARDDVVASLARAVAMESAHLTQERDRRRQQAAQQELLREQDLAYAETVRQDTERQRARAEREASEAAAARAAEEQRRQRKERRVRVFEQVQAAAACLRDEPEAGNTDSVQLVVRLPSGGSQLRRRFLLHDTVSSVYDWVHGGYWTSADSLHALQLVISYPKRELPLPREYADLLSDHSAAIFETTVDENVCSASCTLQQIGITKSQALLAVIIDVEEEDSALKSDNTN